MAIGFRALSEDSGVAGEGERDVVAVADDEDMVVVSRKRALIRTMIGGWGSCQCLVLSKSVQHAQKKFGRMLRRARIGAAGFI